jgi:hypothetical protein
VVLLLLPVVPLGVPVRALGILILTLPFVLVAPKMAPTASSLQVVPKRKAMMTSKSVMLEKHRI